MHKIPKKKPGTFRVIHNPDPLLRVYQWKLLTRILNDLETPDYLWAFEKEKSIPEMASLHTNKAVVLSYDIKDFFSSITNRMIVDTLSAHGIQDKAAVTISEICTYKYFVPQGALTSPKISNLVAAKTFGPVVKAYCDDKGYTLSIYADDITISSDVKLDWDVIHEVTAMVDSTLKAHAFRVNKAKTKVMFRDRRQWVCGAVVNRGVNLMRKERLRLRAIVHNVVTNGYDAEAAKMELSPLKFYEHLRGKLNWFSQLNKDKAQVLIDKLATAGDPPT